MAQRITTSVLRPNNPSPRSDDDVLMGDTCTHTSNNRRANLWTDEEGQQWRTEWCHGCGDELAEYPNN